MFAPVSIWAGEPGNVAFVGYDAYALGEGRSMNDQFRAINLIIGFDAQSRRITIDGKAVGDPIFGRAVVEQFDYQAEADKTCSIHFNPQNVNLEDFRRVLKQFVGLANILNLYKKLLFRGVEPSAINMPEVEYGDSLAGDGGHIAFDLIDLVHGIIGDATESGETVEILLDILDGKLPDRVNVVEEAGDKRWYINRMLRWADVTDLECERINIDKLHGRHGSAFDIFKDANRDLQAERAKLEEAVEVKPTKGTQRRFFGQPCDEAVERRPIGDIEGTDA